MPTLRVFFRVPTLAIWTLVCHSVILLTLPVKSLQPSWQLWIRNITFRTWCRGFAWIVGMRIQVEGHPPKSPCFVVSNHLGYMDIVLLGSQFNTAFVAKSELSGWPIAGKIITTAGNIFVDRERRRDVLRVMELVSQKLDQGLGVVLFPEGTSGKGDGILPFKPPLLHFAAMRDEPVYYVSISYSMMNPGQSAQDVICWWGDAPFGPHVMKLLRLPGFQARLVFGSDPIRESNRKILATKLHQAIEEGFIPVR